jgi:hypothetical protein
MNRRVFWLRACCWLGATVDAIMVVPMVSPSIAAVMFGIDGFRPGVEYRYAMFVGASLMLGWTVLLLWAGRKPVERAGVLLLTVCPVLLGLGAAGVFAVSERLIRPGRMVPTWILQAALAAVFTYGYALARDDRC